MSQRNISDRDDIGQAQESPCTNTGLLSYQASWFDPSSGGFFTA